MSITIEQLVGQIHNSPTKIILAASGGGTHAISALAEVAGASRTLIEAVVPYSSESMADWLGGRPDQFCSASTSRRMAMAGLFRAEQLSGSPQNVAGVACTAGLTTDRPKRGSHRAHVAAQTIEQTVSWSLILEKGLRDRKGEEELVARMVLNAVAEACGVDGRLQIDLSQTENIETTHTESPQLWRELLEGKIDSLCHPLSAKAAADKAKFRIPPPALGRCRPAPKAIFPGAFNPVHIGHAEMAATAEKLLGCPVDMEITIQHPDKPPLDYETIYRRVEQFAGKSAVWLTRAATFEEKSKLFPGTVFIVGADTIRRIADPRYYGGEAGCLAALERIASRGCRFLVFGRDSGTGFANLGHFNLPLVLRSICQEVPAETFRHDISSTAIRREQAWKEQAASVDGE